ncbi:hypothetical protein HNQ80_000389 [Anaerosolibacter carboniphilus]|uniref:Uncharacterized protein n=1 Tax=Anaerosolibacter carboniphilus TaxID=1417629 RepID=A0A841KQF1_9FIRM|nr:hypothetical protein [Anaerosolibacter carboniphilus]MBB6214320.1 hypothetical protein [Anaerosolibacter carboniphilus]
MNIRHITLGGFLVSISIVFQLIPVILGEIFILATILSALPIFILAKINPRTGFIGFIVAGILILSFNSHEGLFFLFTNGPVGLSLGTLSCYSKVRRCISIRAGFILASTLSIMNFIIGIPVLLISIPGTLLIQISILIIFSIFYCFIYLYIADLTFNFLNKHYPFV